MKKKKKAAFDGSLPGSAATGALVLDGNVRAPLVIDFFFFFAPLRTNRSFSATERLTHFRTSQHNAATLPLAKITEAAKYTQRAGIHTSQHL